MKNRLGRVAVLFMAGLGILGFLAGCASPAEEVKTAPEEAEAGPVEITDQAGRIITLDSVPERILSIAPSNTEILFALGLGDKVVAVTDYCNYPEEATTKPSIGSYSKPDIEKIVALTPDIILATEVHLAEVIPALEQVGLTVLVLDPKDLGEVLEAISLVGEITGARAEASELVSELSNRINAVKEKIANLSEEDKPRVFYAVWHDPLMSAGSGTFQDDLIAVAGGKNIAAELSGWATIGLETVLAANPEVMIAGINHAAIDDKNFQFINTEPRLEDTDARRNARVYGIIADLVSRTGPRIVDGLEEFAVLIHPELFGDGK